MNHHTPPSWTDLYCNYVQWKAQITEQLRDYPHRLDRNLRVRAEGRRTPTEPAARRPGPSQTKGEWTALKHNGDLLTFERIIARP